MKESPMVQSAEAWKKHFEDMSEGKMPPQRSYVLRPSPQTGGSIVDKAISIVSPIAAGVQRARATLKRNLCQKGGRRVKRRRTVKTSRKKQSGKGKGKKTVKRVAAKKKKSTKKSYRF